MTSDRAHTTSKRRPEWALALRKAMRDAGLSGARLAEKLRVGHRTVWHWCRGTHRPRRILLPALREALPGFTPPASWSRSRKRKPAA